MKTWTSDVYKHFKSPPTIAQKNGEVRYVFVCKKYGFRSQVHLLCLTIYTETHP
jgi:hypothetical protein